MEEKTKRENNFNIIRMVAALMVMAGHMAYICGTTVPSLFGEGVHAVGVKIFFLVGGFLISKSWLSDSSPIRYIVKRIMRIFPALLVYCLLVTFIFAPLLSTLSAKEYYLNSATLVYLKNILLYPIYSLPGVFELNPYPNAVNGSLWTLPVEFALYIIVPAVITLFGVCKKDKKSFRYISMFTFLLCVGQLIRLYFFPTLRIVVYGTDVITAYDLVPWYFMGIIYTYPIIQKKLNIQVSIVLLLLLSCIPNGTVLERIMLYLIFPYVVFSFVLAEKPFFARMFKKHEISYGVYLYSFFIQQSVVYLGKKLNMNIGYTWCLGISVVLTFVVALISAKVVEEPAQRLCRRILNRIK